MTEDEISQHLHFILEKENITHDLKALSLLSRAADGSMRDGLSLLDQAIAHGGGRVEEIAVKAMLGTIEREPVWSIIEAIALNEANTVFELSDQFAKFGANFESVLDEMIHAIHELALSQKIDYCKEKLDSDGQRLLQMVDAENLQLLYQIAIQGKHDLVLAPTQKTGFEMTLLRMLAFQPQNSTIKKKSKVAALNHPEKNSLNSNQDDQNKATHSGKSSDRGLKQEKHIEQQDAEKIAPNHENAMSSISAKVIDKPSIEILKETHKSVQNTEHKSHPKEDVVTQLTQQKWPKLAESLDVSGFTRQVIIHCHFVSLIQKEHQHILNLNCVNFDPNLINEERVADIAQKLSSLFNTPIAVDICHESHPEKMDVTARDVQISKQQQKIIEAENEIGNNLLVKDIINKFDATIREQSIQPLDNKPENKSKQI